MGGTGKSAMLKTLVASVCLLALTMTPAAALAGSPAQDDVLSRARVLAFSGKEKRPAALKLLQDHLAEDPGDSDARVFYGTVLSWEGRYDEAREQLTQVLAGHPFHGDALPALINVELWSDHPARAEQLAREGVEHDPRNIALMLQQAHALRNLNRNKEAARVLDRALALDPDNQEAKAVRRRVSEGARSWEAQINHTFDVFSGGTASQHETSWSLRGPTPAGSLTGRFNRADRFSDVSYQTEVDFYPHIHSGTYGYVNAGYSSDAVLYPKWRLGADLFHNIGHGFELSGGYRWLDFGSNVNIFDAAVARYYKSYLFTGRTYLTPGDAGLSHTVLFSARRFFGTGTDGTHDYVEVRFSHGASITQATTTLDILSLNSTKGTLVADKTFGRFALSGSFAASSEAQVFGGKFNRYSMQGTFYYRF